MTASQILGEAGFLHAFPERSPSEGSSIPMRGSPPGFDEKTAVIPVVQVRQVHGAAVVEARDAGGREADAVVARAADGLVAVGVRVADCVPILVASEQTGDVVAIHAGWRGVASGVVPAAVETLGGGRFVAAIGPCIGPCCFEVGRDVAEQIARAAPGAEVVTPRPHDVPEKVYVDLRAAVRHQLLRSGVAPSRIEDVPGCTYHEPGRFHSFRRDGAGSGRMLASILTRPYSKRHSR